VNDDRSGVLVNRHVVSFRSVSANDEASRTGFHHLELDHYLANSRSASIATDS